MRFSLTLRLALAALLVCPVGSPAGAQEALAELVRDTVDEYCLGCHDAATKEGELDLESIRLDPVARHTAVWEKAVRKLRGRQMPPLGRSRPDADTYDAVVASLETALDAAAAAHPDPGRTDAIRRLNRTEYGNAIRDLLALEIDAAALLPADDAGHGFDNVTLGDLSPTLLDRAISAAQKIARLAVGGAGRAPGGDTIRIRPDITQEEHVEGLPLGTRGGALLPYHFPADGEYEIRVRLARDRNEEVEGLRDRHEVEVLIDRRRVARFTVAPPKDKDYSTVDAHLAVRVPVTAGPHDLGVTFVTKSSSLIETKRQPYNAHFNMHRHPRLTPAVYQVSITGPFEPEGPGDTPSRRRIFVCRPGESSSASDEEDCARRIVSTLMRRAYRRPVTDADLEKPLEFFRQARANDDFDAGIEMALTAVLVSPQFLLRVERDPPGAAPGSVHRVSDLELASRLSFFLWSSIPDDELLDAAERGELSEPAAFERQVRRLLADPRSSALVTNFAAQWLYLRNLETVMPDQRLFTDFDDNLRQAMRRETELLFESIVREDRSVLELLQSDHTYLNERLARHYGIPHVLGDRFRRVELPEGSLRGGLLRHGSILTVTSYATRTSPVIRGNWILENILGTPPPPPPANVPALTENTVSANLSMRERLAEHRSNSACSSCHRLMDPIGFALENFDAVGRWRDVERGEPIDASGSLPDGSEFDGVAGLEQGLLRRPELFAGTLAEKLLTFALGRGVEHHDAPAIRRIVRDARAQDYRFSSLILGVATSAPFQMRTSR